MRSSAARTLRVKKLLVTAVLAAAVVVPAAASGAQTSTPTTTQVQRAEQGSDRARDTRNPTTASQTTDSVWSDPSLIGSGGLKFG